MNKKVYKLGKEFINIDFIKMMTKPKRIKIEDNKDYECISFEINGENYYKENYIDVQRRGIKEINSPIHSWQIYIVETSEHLGFEFKEDKELQEYNDFCIEADKLFNAFINK